MSSLFYNHNKKKYSLLYRSFLLATIYSPYLLAGGVLINQDGSPNYKNQIQQKNIKDYSSNLGYSSNLNIFGKPRCFSTAKFTVLTGKSTCPSICEIRKLPGTNNWETIQQGWKGGFISPIQGQGISNQVAQFIGAKWIKTSNVQNGAGFVECEYLGDKKSAPQSPNCGTNLPQVPLSNLCSNSSDPVQLRDVAAGEDEIIRFTQSGNNAAKPTGTYWAQNTVTHIFPSVQKACSNSIEDCTFYIDKE